MKAPWNQQRRILRNIERVLGKAGKGITVEMRLVRHYPHPKMGNIRMLFILIIN